MTAVKGNTPRKGNRELKKDSKKITSRIIGVEVHCGPIHGTMLYYTDNVTAGGASIIIEVTRQALLDLQKLLAECHDLSNDPLDMPQHIIFQFDNCPENKNKFVFAYFALLVQEGHFTKIEVFFLIVGHTHASIDQYFSVISRQIYWCNFLGSPLALEQLLSRESFDMFSWSRAKTKVSVKAKPLLVRKISVVYNMNQALAPLINNTIKYYPIPHRFVFEMYYGVCAMQYSMFSTHKVLLPVRPAHISGKLNICHSDHVHMIYVCICNRM